MRKISWILKRHSLLYSTRFRLLSRNSSKSEVASETYNSYNKAKDIPEYYFEVNKEVFKDVNFTTDLEKAMHLACWLRKNIKGGSGLSLSSDLALRTMLEGKGGVCSDISQVYNNFCVINNLLVREWGITTIPFNKKYGGHATNEIFSKELNKWVLIDVSKCILFHRIDNEKPLSVLEVFQAKEQLRYDPFLKEIKDDKQIKIYYFGASATPFLISKYKNKVYDKFLTKNSSKLPVFIVHFLVYLTGNSYHYKFPLNDYRNMFKSTIS
ncbi:hypothetical protein [Winogradskyella sp. Asnod2-B02-A]|uniref:hypothetical protein n=1 Tax=Winogradskyella sp. Asnod2-B02-A TaxID=3160583 RepID=UPI0038650FC6